jgi:Rnl2 family RNA ligase
MFNKYNSIENSYNTKFIEKIYDNGYHKEEWLAMEKIHGANFSIIVCNNGVSYCRRTDILKDNEGFFNYQTVVKPNEKKYIEIFEYLKVEHENLVQIQIYGEIFGGKYTHAEVSKNTKVSQVQGEICYHPDVKFIIFDISYKKLDDEYITYISHDEVIDIAKKYDLMCSEILHRGSFDDLLKLNPLFETTVPSLFGLPKINNNVAEGYVLKPNRNIFFKCGSRVIIKHKNDVFKEKNPENKTVERNQNSLDVDKKIMFSYLNENRLASVKSKLTDEENNNKEFVIAKLIDDAIEDITKEHEREFNFEKLREIAKKYCNSKKYY